MKRLTTYCLLLFCLFSCQSKQNNQSKSAGDSVVVTPKQETITINDSMVLPLSKEILTAVKNKDYKKFASFIDTEEGK